MQHNQNLEEKFSEDHEKNLRIENDILKLKLQATYGADMYSENTNDLPPEIENEFLKNVFAFEEAMKDEQLQKIYDQIGKPSYKLSSAIHDDQISQELTSLYALLKQNNIQLDVLGKYDDRIIYEFITEELFDHEVLMCPNIPGFTMHFIYEEFHPNNGYDIENRVHEFFTDWFERNFNEHSFELANNILLADGKVMEKMELIEKFKLVFDSYTSFSEREYSIREVKFQMNEDDKTGMGYAEGEVKYYATIEDGSQVLIGGNFKFYFSSENNWWQIFYFTLPGFEW